MTDGTLYVVATPIGNLEDITVRALRILENAGVIAAEDTRVTAKLLSHNAISTPTVSIRGEKTKKNISALLKRLTDGEDVALVTDAGTPSVSDPGYELVVAAHEAAIPVSPIPGPSALASAVSVAGLKGEGVRFIGFLPRSGRRRKEMLSALRTERSLVVLYESPRRLGATLSDIANVCGERVGAVLRELTKIHEEVVRATISELSRRFEEGTRGEVTIAIEGVLDAGKTDIDEVSLRDLIARELASGRTVKDVAASVSSGFGLSRKNIYEMALQIRKNAISDYSSGHMN